MANALPFARDVPQTMASGNLINQKGTVVAGFKEMGIGIASALASPHTPNPLSMTLRDQDLPEAARIVLAVLDECRAAGIKLEKVELDPELYAGVRQRFTGDECLASNADLQCEVRFFVPKPRRTAR